MRNMESTYNGGLTREKFLFYEMRIVAKLLSEGLSREDIISQVQEENLFQFPTEKMIVNIAKTCFKRIDALDSQVLIDCLANASVETAKQINLYAMMKYNRIVWDFMVTVIGEKYRTQDFDFTQRDLNVFFANLREQDDNVASWTDGTVERIKLVLKRSIAECGYLDSMKSERLNNIAIAPELEDEIKEAGDYAALPAFNCFR